MDLANFDRQGRYNRGYNFLLCVIDAFTRKAWVVPLKNKKASTVLDGFKTIHAQAGRIDKLASDLGKEFFNREFAAYCQERNIRHFCPRTSGKAVLAERFIKTLKKLLMRYMTARKTRTFLPALEGIVEGYNNKYHRILRTTPQDLEDDPVAQRAWTERLNEYYFRLDRRRRPVSLETDHVVRIQLDRGKLGRYPTYSSELYVIVKVDDSKPVPLYTLCRVDERVCILGKFKPNEVTRVLFAKGEPIGENEVLVQDSTWGPLRVHEKNLV